MNRALLAVVAALLALAGVSADQTARRTSWAEATPITESDAVRAGQTAHLALQVEVADGFHVQSNHPRDPLLIPTTLSIRAPEGATVNELVFPAAIDFNLAGSDKPLAVFERTFVVGVTVTIGKQQKPGPLTIPATLRYQACDAVQCFKPTLLETSWTLRVASANEKITRQHQDVFRSIAFGHGEPPSLTAPSPAPAPPANESPSSVDAPDLLQQFDRFAILGTAGGYMKAAEFLEFIHNAENGVKPKGLFEGRGTAAILGIVFAGGVALNLTPCVLPMVPINLAIIGAGAQRSRRSRGFLLGAAYGGAMAMVYGVLGLVVILTAGTFGTINASPWFNVGIAALFIVLGLAMFDVIPIDFSRFSSGIRFSQEGRGSVMLAFAMGAVAALLAGACVAPVVIQVIVFASNLYASGSPLALGLPFCLGLGMALPWPIAGAGLASLPKPGMWMVRVKHVLGLFILATAVYYGYVAFGIFANRWVDPSTVEASVQRQLKSGWHASLREGLATAERTNTPVLIDFWATWCKNCLTMDQTTLANAEVASALSGYTKIKFQAEDPEASPAAELMKRVGGVGLPTYAILKKR